MLLSLLLQADTNPEPPESVAAALIWLGGVIVAGLLIALRTLWVTLQGERKTRETDLERMIVVTSQATAQISESEDTVAEAMKAVETATGFITRLPTEAMTDIAFHLRELKEMKARAEARATARKG